MIRKLLPLNHAALWAALSLILLVFTLARLRGEAQMPPSANAQFASQQVLAELQRTQERIGQAVRDLYQAQSLLEQKRLHQERAHNLQLALDQVREDFSSAQRDYQVAADQISELQNQIQGEANPDLLKALRDELNDLKPRLNDYAQRQARAQQREAQYADEIKTETADLAAVTIKLAALERELFAQPQPRRVATDKTH